jgi:acetylornithine deacetylase/succinyl-diaminopimelate desuccinylase-like protein
MTVMMLDKVRRSLATEMSVDLTQAMVKIDSTCGKEIAIALDLENRLKALEIGKVWCETIPDGRLNVLWQVDSGRVGPHLLLTGHLDTKPVCEGWVSDPFSGHIADGRLHGHGVMDMKAGVGSLAGAVKTLVDSGVDFRGKITFAAVADHMGNQSGSIDLFNRHKFDHCVLGELTDMQVYIAHRGRYYFDISTIGLAAHTCHKYAAVNAIELMLPVIDELSKLKYFPEIAPAIKDLVGPELFTAVGRIYGGLFPGGPSMIPDRCTIRVDTRPQPGVDLPEVQALIDGALERAKARDPRIKLESVVADIKDGFMVRPDAPIVTALSGAWADVMGEQPKLVGGSWLGDTASFGKLCDTVIFGPGGYPVYQPNESLPLTDIAKATRIYALTAATILQAA